MAQRSLNDVLALPPLAWRIDKLLPEKGMLVLGGAPKRGKSRLALDIARRLVQGRSALGVLPVNKASRVLVYNIEGGHAGVKARESMFEPMSSDERDALVIENDPIVFTHSTGTVRDGALSEALAAWTGFDVVVLDPLVHFRGCDENNNQHSGALMRAMRACAEKVNTSLIVVHHARKSQPDSEPGGEQLRGASAIFAAADNVLMLGRQGALLECAFDLRYAAVAGDLDGLVLQSDLVSGLMYRRVVIGTSTFADPRDFALDWGNDPARYAKGFDLSLGVAQRIMEEANET